MKVVVTGGGTGGHIYPALSIARQLRERGAGLLFVGSQHGPEGRLAELEQVPFRSVPSGPIAGLLSARTARSVVKLLQGIGRSYSILGRFKPDVVVGTGGYTSAGVVFAEWLRGGRIVIHEQNSIPGRTNRLLALFANKVCVTFEDSLCHFPKKKTVLTGLPVRPAIIEGVNKREASVALDLDPLKFTVLVIGGSQGAQRINEVMLEAGPELARSGMQVLHLTGSKNYGDMLARKPEQDGYVISPYLDDMENAYCASDVVVGRSGASTIAEITVRGLPSVLIPYPFAHANHQLKNAESVARAGAAIVLEESGLTADLLVETIRGLESDGERRREMAKKSKDLGRPNAAAEIADIVEEVAAGK